MNRMSEFDKDTNVPTNDCISRQALKNALINWQMEYSEKDKDVERFDTIGKVIDLVEQMPTAEPKTGRWIKNEDRCGWQCSECMTDNIFAYDWDSETGVYKFQDFYCPHCGVKMEKDEDIPMEYFENGGK